MTKRKVIVHIMPYDKFAPAVIRKTNRVFKEIEHYYIIGPRSTDVIVEWENEKNIIKQTKKKTDHLVEIIKLLWKADRVVLHSYCLQPLWECISLIFMIIMRKKYVWMIWGYDLSNEIGDKRVLYRIIRKTLKNNVIKRVAFIAVSCHSDYIKAMMQYKTKGKEMGIIYPFELPLLKKNELTNKADNIVQVAILNCADIACRHIEVLETLKRYKERDIRIYCVLSYPKTNTEYINEVIQYGEKIFGDKFVAITEFMKYKEYQKFLEDIDIAIFNNNRQQAGGNLTNLLYMGKKIYMSPLNGLYQEYLDAGALIYDVDEMEKEDFFYLLSESEKKKNKEIIEYRQSDEFYRKCWGPALGCKE